MPADPVALLVYKWQSFAATLRVTHNGVERSWTEHLYANPRKGYADEVKLVQPTVFPRFAEQFLGFASGTTLGSEQTGRAGVPDFTPADAVSHPFVFETKGTDVLGGDFSAYLPQITRYLTVGKPRVQKVVVTNMRAISVYALDAGGAARCIETIDLVALLPKDPTAKLDPDLKRGVLTLISAEQARRFAGFVNEFRHRDLSPDERVSKIREAAPWVDELQITSTEWVSSRFDEVVKLFTREVERVVAAGALTGPGMTERRKVAILGELQQLADRLAVTNVPDDLTGFLSSAAKDLQVAVAQFCAHVANFTATRLLLVRIWEDLGVINKPFLFDGGFDTYMRRFDNAVDEVVSYAMVKSKDRYPAFFEGHDTYDWWKPERSVLIDALYALAHTYLGKIEADVFGAVYERMLARIDRKLLGVYYTPRDIVRLILDLANVDALAQQAQDEDRELRVFDIATGSGGFLVEATAVLRRRFDDLKAQGADFPVETWLERVARGMVGIEYQRFSAFLAEVNLVVLMSRVLADAPGTPIPELGILTGDTLTFHEPNSTELEFAAPDTFANRKARAKVIKAVDRSNFAIDLACGNPPYIGEKSAADKINALKKAHPYWRQFTDARMDYLYPFLITGISKLRPGGRFAFITTEYWLRARSARKLRRYIAVNCEVDRIVLFRKFRLFPDALGQHSMIITGTRVTGRDESPVTRPAKFPVVSIYEGGHTLDPVNRDDLLDRIRRGKPQESTSEIRTRVARRDPRSLGEQSWDPVIFTEAQLKVRTRMTADPQAERRSVEGIVCTAKRLKERDEARIAADALAARGGTKSSPGIHALSIDEVEAMGALNDAERVRLRAEVNTEAVFPYGVVLDLDRCDHLLYLSQSDGDDAGGSIEEVIESTPFPDGLPAFKEHLAPFRDLLVAKVMAYGKRGADGAWKKRPPRRAWWTLHNDRRSFFGNGEAEELGFAPYVVTSRWGEGGRFLVGLAPKGSVPSSALHAIVPADGVPAAYLAGLFNSSIFQEVIDSIPPGQLRSEDIENLGAPLVESVVDEVASEARTLAGIVARIVTETSSTFPNVARDLRRDPDLGPLDLSVWCQSFHGPATGTLASAAWIHTSAGALANTGGLGVVRLASQDEIGRTVIEVLRIGGNQSPVFRASVDMSDPASDEHDDAVYATMAFMRGVRHSVQAPSASLLAQARIPVSARALLDRFRGDAVVVEALAAEYRTRRARIDDLLREAMSG